MLSFNLSRIYLPADKEGLCITPHKRNDVKIWTYINKWYGFIKILQYKDP